MGSTLAGIDFFATTVESGSFASAARRLGVTASAVSRRVSQLEQELGVSLLARTTRSLSLTDDGRAFHERCLRILEELREARDAVARARQKPSGTLRVDAPVSLGRLVLSPKIPDFLRQYPEVNLELTMRDTFIDPVFEGIDVVVRMGALAESALIARKLGDVRPIVCGSPTYLKKRGVPKTLDDLDRHDCLAYLRDGRPDPWRFVIDGVTHDRDVRGSFHANDSSSLRRAAVAGHGLVMLFDFTMGSALRRGRLVQVLTGIPTPARPIHALYPKNRHLLPKVRAFVDYLAAIFQKRSASR